MNNKLIEETAKAWNVTPKYVKRLARWVNTLPRYKRNYVFGRALVRKREKQYSASRLTSKVITKRIYTKQLKLL